MRPRRLRAVLSPTHTARRYALACLGVGLGLALVRVQGHAQVHAQVHVQVHAPADVQAPAQAQSIPASATSFGASVSPPRVETRQTAGAAWHTALVLQHEGARPASYRVSLSDWALPEDGPMHFGPGDAATSCLAWAQLDRSEVLLKPQARATFRLGLRVPAQARDGECRLAVLFEETRPRVDDAAPTVAGRLAVVVYVRIGDARPRLRLNAVQANPRQDADGGWPVLRVQNEGDATARLSGLLQAQDARGRRQALVPDALPILPGQARLIPLQAAQGAHSASAGGAAVARPVYPLQLKGRLQAGDQTLLVDQVLSVK